MTNYPKPRPRGGFSRRDLLRGALAGGALVSVGGILNACGDDDDSGAEPGDEPLDEPIDADAIVLGGFSSVTGASAYVGQSFQRGVELAVDDVNARGGILGRPVEVLWRDDTGSADQAVTVAREYIDRGVDFLVGGHNSSVNLAVSEQARLAQIPYIAASGTAALTANRWHRYVFRGMLTNDFAIAASAADVAAEQPWETYYMIGGDYEYPRSFWGLFREELSERRPDVQFIGEQWPAFGTPDYTAQINAILSARPDCVVSALWSSEVVTFIQQARGFGYFEEVEHFGPAQIGIESAFALGEETPDLISGQINHPFWLFDNEMNNQMVSTHRDRYGEIPSDWTGCAHTGIMFIEAAANEAGTVEADPFVDALEGIQIDSVWGTIEMRACDHQAIVPLHWGRTGNVPDLDLYLMSEDVVERSGAELYRSCEAVEALRDE